jgi:hypothetical protein
LTSATAHPYVSAGAQMAELVDALVSGTSGESRGGSSPLLGTIPGMSISSRAAGIARTPSFRGRRFYLLNRACPVFPAAVFNVKVIAAPGAIGFFASPFIELSPNGAKVTVSRFGPLTIRTAPV